MILNFTFYFEPNDIKYEIQMIFRQLVEQFRIPYRILIAIGTEYNFGLSVPMQCKYIYFKAKTLIWLVSDVLKH